MIEHLERKGKVAVMTKAASFLLWCDDFSQIRNYLLEHIAWMISDASGIPPRYAEPAGFEQITYGDFTGPYFIQDPSNDARGVHEDVERAAAPRPAVPVRLPRQGEAQPPDGHAAEVPRAK